VRIRGLAHRVKRKEKRERKNENEDEEGGEKRQEGQSI
jgi:hypothetical protein